MDDPSNDFFNAYKKKDFDEIERLLRIFPLDTQIKDEYNKSYMIVVFLLTYINDDDYNQKLFDIIFNALPSDPNYRFNECTISEIALICRRIDFFEYLVSKIGFNVSLESQQKAMEDLWDRFYNTDYILTLLKLGFNIQSLSNSNRKMLHIIVKYGSDELFNVFIANKIQINTKTIDNKLPLHAAIKHNNDNRAKKLIENGAIINYAPGEIYMPLLFYAVNYNTVECVKLLLNNGVSLTDTYEERDILYYAIRQQVRIKIIQLLVEKGANINHKYGNNTTITHWAAHKSDYQVIKYFILKKIHINTYSDNHFSPLLTFLAEYNHSIDHNHVCELTLLFLENGADINDKNSYNQTPLHYAIDTRNIELCQLLLEKGAIISTEEIDDLVEEAKEQRRQEGLEFTIDNRNIIDCIIETPIPEIIEIMFNQGLELPDDYCHIESRMIYYRNPENRERCRILLNTIYNNQQKKRLNLEQLCFMAVVNNNIEYEDIAPKYIIEGNMKFFYVIYSKHPEIIDFKLKLFNTNKRTRIEELPDDNSNKHTRLH